MRWLVPVLVGLGLAVSGASAQVPGPLPPPPVPPPNQVTEAKRVLGKILFWDEQLSSDDTIACGSCHRAGSGGSDARIGINPGVDGLTPSPDDVRGSPGVMRVNAAGVVVPDPIFGFGVQVTSRAANTTIGAAYARDVFWDGRASSTFVDPETGLTSIALGGGLESQSVVPIVSSVEMAHEGRTWDDVRGKLARCHPLANATDLPPDVGAALTGSTRYPDLFTAAFGDPAITAERIAFAVATYERTLVANRTPWDAFVAGNPQAMTPGQVAGWDFFRNSPCQACHTPPTFTDHTFRNIGIRPPGEDLGRQTVTGLLADRGRFKVPTLRNVGLKSTHMHTGGLPDVTQSVLWYAPGNPQRSIDNLDPILPVPVPPDVLPALVDFLANGLTDPRVAASAFPFDQPMLHAGALKALDFEPDGATMTWDALTGVTRYNVYRGDIADLGVVGADGLPAAGYGVCISDVDVDPSDTTLVDPETPASGEGFFYVKSVVDASGAERGLGATSDGLERLVLVSCAGP